MDYAHYCKTRQRWEGWQAIDTLTPPELERILSMLDSLVRGAKASLLNN